MVRLQVHGRMAGEGLEKARALLLQGVESLTPAAPTVLPPGSNPDRVDLLRESVTRSTVSC